MARVRTAYSAGPFVTIEGEHIGSKLIVPERRVKTGLQFRGLLRQFLRDPVMTEFPCDLGRSQPGSIDVALYLA